MFVDKDQSTRRSELCWSLLSAPLRGHHTVGVNR